jgi:nitroreductase
MNEVMTVIKARHTDRSPYAKRRVTDAALGILLEAARWAPTAHNMQNFEIMVIDDPATLVSLGSVRREISEAFLRENYRQLSFSEEELRRKKTGVLARTFPPSWQRPNADVTSMEPSFLRDSWQGSQTLLLVLYDPAMRAPDSEGDFLGIMSLGCVMQNLWLAAQNLGVSMQVLSALGTTSVQRELRAILRIPETPKCCLRLQAGLPNATDCCAAANPA